MLSSPITALLLSLATPLGAAAELSCRVIEVADGDSFTCLTADHRLERIRLQAIDAPENGQPFGQYARQNLAALLLERPVTVRWEQRDRDGRILGSVWVSPPDCPACGHTLDVGAAQLAAGMAWWLGEQALQTEQERERYRFEEHEARARRTGLWRDAEPLPPWEWHGS